MLHITKWRINSGKKYRLEKTRWCFAVLHITQWQSQHSFCFRNCCKLFCFLFIFYFSVLWRTTFGDTNNLCESASTNLAHLALCSFSRTSWQIHSSANNLGFLKRWNQIAFVHHTLYDLRIVSFLAVRTLVMKILPSILMNQRSRSSHTLLQNRVFGIVVREYIT